MKKSERKQLEEALNNLDGIQRDLATLVLKADDEDESALAAVLSVVGWFFCEGGDTWKSFYERITKMGIGAILTSLVSDALCKD